MTTAAPGTPPITALQQCVTAQVALLEEFIAQLETEGAVLLQTPSDEALRDMTLRKQDYARRLSEADAQRVHHLDALGCADHRDAVAALCTEHAGLAQAFARLWSLADQASELNHRNGHLLHTFLAHNQQALDTLRSLRSDGLYDARGQLAQRR